MTLGRTHELGIRDSSCPICGGATGLLLALTFGKKLDLPTHPEIRICEVDDFAFVAGATQAAYDEYYQSVINDYYRREISDTKNAPVILQEAVIIDALGSFFNEARRVLDFGCGEANLLEALANKFPTSKFVGFDPSPSTAKAAKKGLENLSISGTLPSLLDGQYDLIIVSHVLEHLIDFSSLSQFSRLLSENGLLYVEVPDALRYAKYPRRSFLYYFDRLHVNHFSPLSLKRLLKPHGLSHCRELFYSFPYADGGNYPALGMLFNKNGEADTTVDTMALKRQLELYITTEQTRAKGIAEELNVDGGLLVWGGGDNFYRLLSNGGPLADIENIILLDRSSRKIDVGSRHFFSIDPDAGIEQFDYPIVITVSEASSDIIEQIVELDKDRKIFLL